MQSLRAPSYKAIAIAILKNDMNLYSLGFSSPAYERQQQVAHMAMAACGICSEPVKQMDFVSEMELR